MQLWTIGHSNHTLERFLELLREHEIEVVVDARSQPFSSYSPHFTREALQPQLNQAGIRYVFLGRELGGRPEDSRLYDDDGHVLYSAVAKTPLFTEGIVRLLKGASEFRIALMCSEEDPSGCHRHLLVTRVLRDKGTTINHIRGDGTTISEEALAERTKSQQRPLFGEDESTWRSLRSVSRSGPRRTSSAH